MPHLAPNSIECTIKSVVRQVVPLEFWAAVQEALYASAEEAHDFCQKTSRLNADRNASLGQERCWQTRKKLVPVFEKFGTINAPIRTNNILTMHKSGVAITCASIGPCSQKLRFSKQRAALSAQNKALTEIHQPDLFGQPIEEVDVAVWIVADYEKDIVNAPHSINVVIPHKDGVHWLYKWEINALMNEYDSLDNQQDDLAVPRLKAEVKKLYQDAG